MKSERNIAYYTWVSGLALILGLNVACSSGGSTAKNEDDNATVVSECGGVGGSSGLLTNGDFEAGVGSWSGNAANVLQDTNGNSLNYANIEAAGNPWDVNLSLGVEITSGETYKLTFSAKSDGARTMVAGIGLNEDPWTSSTQTVNLSNTCQNFELELTAGFGNSNSRVLFDMGAATGEVIIDDVALVVTTPSVDAAPNTTAPTPSENSTISVYSDAYTDISTRNLNPNWGQGTIFSEETIAGGNVIKLKSLNYQGIEMDPSYTVSQDVTGLTTLHVDYWTDDSTALNIYLISTGPAEIAYPVSITTGSWQSLDIPLSTFSGTVDLSDIIQMKFDGNGTVYLDNIYFF